MQAPSYESRDEDTELATVMSDAIRAMESVGLTTQDLLDALPPAGMALMREWYGDAFVDDLVRQHAAAQRETGAR